MDQVIEIDLSKIKRNEKFGICFISLYKPMELIHH